MSSQYCRTFTNICDAPVGRLVESARQGDSDAFEELVRRHRKRAYNVAYRILKHSEDAEDAVQDAMVRLFKKIDTFRGDSAFSTWLSRIVINVSLMHLRKRGNTAVYSLEETVGPEHTLMEVLTSDAASPEHECLQREYLSLVQRVLGKLSSNLHDITLDRFAEELSIDEISKKRGISQAATKSRLLRARKMILAEVPR
ncbi:RNA polymerase sigma factor [Terriglobus tenax]|uniref:RNA polymerase sigma factor n=1 Tax=Terriglobus tenax TaxID=1111115 RepID=UPI0021DFB33F|nr:sigma-70 family RNA polymerase sigma factor [Terriglobus tenax]